MSVANQGKPLQVIRPVYKDASGTIIPMTKTVSIKPRFDSKSDEYIILWNDVKMVLANPLYACHDNAAVPFLMDDDFEFLRPLRILAYPGTVLDVVIEAPEIEGGLKPLRVSKPTTSNSTSASPTIPCNDFAPSQNRGTTRGTESSPTAAANNPIQQALRAPQDRGEPLEINCSVMPQSIGRAPQLVPDSNSGRNDLYNHKQPSVEESGHDISERRPSESDECGRKSINDNYKKGLMYCLGKGVVQDYPRAKEYFFKAAIHGHAGAQYCLGNMYKKGQGVRQEYSKAVEWYQKSASQGYANAQNNLGIMYRGGYAIEWYQKAASQGDATAQTNLGSMYQKGYGVVQDYSKAIEWYQKAASQGDATAQYNLGVIYHCGYGVVQDYSKAVGWYQKAASQGDANAQHNLGVMYKKGYGVAQDYPKAIEWYQKTASQGDATAQNNLGILYKNG
ncbi:hypothetical protein BGX20_008974 [Mortierella sp. AD010]|nr:hypothetical protein BGX20_008974 [Mortierella sp. AD010]